MTSTAAETLPGDSAPPADPVSAATPLAGEPSSRSSPAAARARPVQSVLEKLFELYPQLFGAEFRPLKLGIFQELLAAHPEQLQRESLKAALGFHTRSTRYLQSVAVGHKRHDLQGNPGEEVAPEHVYLTLLELFRRRQARAREDLRPKFRAQLMAAYEASGLSRQDYQAKVQNSDADATALLEEAFAEREQKLAKREALRRTFESSGKSADEFAGMYGIDKRELAAAIKA
ncbi:MAG: prop effector [Polaromonas sp.]|nr:prop effector [Polaromonas sp.]